MRTIALLSLLLAMSGCATPSESTVMAVDGGVMEDVVGAVLHADECHGFRLVQSYAPGQNPAPLPPGWPESDNAWTSIVLDVLRCTALGLGPLERPVTMVWETSDNAEFPPACSDGIDESPLVVLNVLANDEAFVGRLLELGLPATLVEFDVEEGMTKRWSWSVAGAVSTVGVQGAVGLAGNDAVDRWLWQTPNGTAWMDMDKRPYRDAYDLATAVGAFDGPHHIGVGGHFVGDASYTMNAGFTGRIHTGGVDCA